MKNSGWALVMAVALGVSPDPVAAEHMVRAWVSSADMTRTLTPSEPIVIQPKAKANLGDFVIEVDPKKTYQSILGMGGSFEHTTCYNLFQLGPERMAETIERLVNPDTGIGMNLMRICIGTPDFTGEPWYSYDDMPPGEQDRELAHFSIEKDKAYVLPVLKKALEKNPDLLFFASPWSPPGWMKSCEDMIGGHLLPKYYDVYARYFVKFVQAYGAEGVPVYAVTPQNEPGMNTRENPVGEWYPSCQWSLIKDPDTFWPVDVNVMGHNERDFIKKFLGPAFKNNGAATKIWCYDHNFNNPGYPRAILSDPETARYVDGTAFHGYGGKPADMGAFHDEFPEKDVYFSEGTMPGIRGALRIVDLFRNWSRTYNDWVMMIDYDGKPNNGPFKTKSTCIQPRRDGSGVDYHFTYFSYGQFMKFVKRNALRIASTEGGRAFNNVAFKNPNGEVVLVVVNGQDKDASFAVTFGKEAFTAALPGKSVGTFVWPRQE
jgi:glucosylceramidase